MNVPGRTIRWILAILALTAGALLARRSDPSVLYSIFLFGITALLILPELLRPFTWGIDFLLGTLPGSGGKPPLDLRLARFYEREERYEDALGEYERVMKNYPRELEPYERSLHLIAELGGTQKELDALYQKALRRIRDEGMRESLRDAYEEAKLKLSRLTS